MSQIKGDSNLTPHNEDYLRKVTVGERKPHNASISLITYDPQWAQLFKREAKQIRLILGKKVIQLEHVGSTSVPELCAKPIIDMLLVVLHAADESTYVHDLERAGYTLRIREPGWFEHRLFKGPNTNINLHVFSKGVSEIERMLCFRDWLRKNKADREKYAHVKQNLAKQEWRHVQNYADAKSAIIREIMGRAECAED